MTGFVIYLNMAPIVWFSKRHPTVESSVFGAECVAMKNGIETTHGLCYKLIMMDAALESPTYIYGDIMSLVRNTQCLQSVLKKKSNIVCYHVIQDSVLVGESSIVHVYSVKKYGDSCTKVVPCYQMHDHLIDILLHNLVDLTCCVHVIILLSKEGVAPVDFLVAWATTYIHRL
jgi:hypothetical protein